MEKAVNIADQEKEKAIFEKEKEAQEKHMDVENVQIVRHAKNLKEQKEIDGQAEEAYAKGLASAEALKSYFVKSGMSLIVSLYS